MLLAAALKFFSTVTQRTVPVQKCFLGEFCLKWGSMVCRWMARFWGMVGTAGAVRWLGWYQQAGGFSCLC